MAEKIVIVGDLFPTSENFKEFIDGDSKLIFGEKISQIIKEAKYSICNLEGALTDCNSAILKSGPNIKAPISTVLGIRNLGITYAALANNHTMDYGKLGFEDTIKALESSGIRPFGAGESKSTLQTHINFLLENKKIVVYNVAETEFNFVHDNSPGVNVFDEHRVCSEIETLKRENDFVIVIYHGGAERFRYPTPKLRERFHLLADCGADVVLAQHSHCIGTVEKYNSSTLLYGQGNFCFARDYNEFTKTGLMVSLTINAEQLECEFIKVVRKNGYVEYDEKQDLKEFDERSKLLCDEVINSEYNKFCSSLISDYYNYFYRNSIVTRILHKVGIDFIPLKREKALLGAINMMRCEAHQEKFTTGLLQLYNELYDKDVDNR